MLSTPLICCSMGVATACSIVWASAPTYLVWIWISGGAMLGNCATGRLTIAIVPTMTVKMAITIATMGRLMKNLDIRLCVDLNSLTNLLHALNDDALTRREALVDDPFGANGLTELDSSDFYGVVVIDDRDLTRSLKVEYRALRNQQCAFLCSNGGPDLTVQPRAQTVSRVRK